VILSIGPYFNHSGQTGPAGPVEGTSYDPLGPSTGPSDRFLDFVNGAHLMERGYTFVMVDLRGFGGSTGCLDWGGPGEQSDVVSAVQWAAAQPWSTGAVGMYGKSYDGVTGLIGVNKRPSGLKAVVSQEPVYDLYRYLYGDGIRRENSLLTPALYDVIDQTPGPLADAPDYNLAGADDTQRPGCKVLNWADQAANDDHFSPYWRARNLIPGAAGSDVPLFLTQGLTENNTVADGTAQYLRNHTGPERAWLGPWEHVRGNETDETGRLKMGRAGFFDEVMRFYDRFLKGETPAVEDPPIAVQTNDGVWRAEQQWPPADAAGYTTTLRTGTYTDDGTASSTGSSATNGIWTVSQPLAHAVHLSGSGTAVVDVSTQFPNANLVVDVYDLDENGRGPLITRQGHLIRSSGPITLDLWSADWKLAAGHRIGVRIADANTDWWVHVPTKQTVTVHGASVTLPFLPQPHSDTIAGDPGVQLSAYLARRVTVPAATLQSAQTEFSVP
jgi:predicted acyl esterase